MFMLAAQQWCPWCRGHMGWGGGAMMMGFWLVVLVVIVLAAWAVAQRGGLGPGGAARENRAEALLRERFARGEIDQATYRQMLDELRRP